MPSGKAKIGRRFIIRSAGFITLDLIFVTAMIFAISNPHHENDGLMLLGIIATGTVLIAIGARLVMDLLHDRAGDDA